jgi:hypothetical protein
VDADQFLIFTTSFVLTSPSPTINSSNSFTVLPSVSPPLTSLLFYMTASCSSRVLGVFFTGVWWAGLYENLGEWREATGMVLVRVCW